MDLGKDTKHLILSPLIFNFFQPCGLADRDEAGSSTWVSGISGFGLYPSLSKSRSCTAADKLVISDSDQSYYQFRSTSKLWLSFDPMSVLVHHNTATEYQYLHSTTNMRIFLGRQGIWADIKDKIIKRFHTFHPVSPSSAGLSHLIRMTGKAQVTKYKCNKGKP